MKLFIALSALGAALARSPNPTIVSRETIVNRVNSLTTAVSDSATKLERAERASVTKERMAQWTNFIADVEEHIPELLQDTATVAGAQAQMYEPLDFPAFVSASPPAGTSTWNPFEPWLVQLKAYRTYMANYIDYQITWVYKLKCTFTGDCNVHTTMSAAPQGATVIVVASTAGIAKDDKLMIPGTTTAAAAFLEAAATSTDNCYTVVSTSGNSVTITPGLKALVAEGGAVTKSTSCLAASPAAAAAGGAVTCAYVDAKKSAAADGADNVLAATKLGLVVAFTTTKEVPVDGFVTFHVDTTGTTTSGEKTDIAFVNTKVSCVTRTGVDQLCGHDQAGGGTPNGFGASGLSTDAALTDTVAAGKFTVKISGKKLAAGKMEFRLNPFTKPAGVTAVKANVETFSPIAAGATTPVVLEAKAATSATCALS